MFPYPFFCISFRKVICFNVVLDIPMVGKRSEKRRCAKVYKNTTTFYIQVDNTKLSTPNLNFVDMNFANVAKICLPCLLYVRAHLEP